jgi:ABC-type transport system involved in Fe-S cluster assembly fused permease/ATPase subunit
MPKAESKCRFGSARRHGSDTETEALIQKAIHMLMARRTSIVIAH